MHDAKQMDSAIRRTGPDSGNFLTANRLGGATGKTLDLPKHVTVGENMVT